MSQKNYTIGDIDKMINEEYSKAKKAMVLKKELDSLNEEEAKLKKELGIDEVSVGGRHSGSEWYEKDLPNPKFEKIGSHLKEMEGLEDEDMGDTEDMESGYFESKLAELGRELDVKIGGGEETPEEPEEMDMEMGAEEAPEEMEMEIGFGDEDEDEDEGEDEGEDEEMDETQSKSEFFEVDASGVIDEECDEEETETVDEQAGESIVSAADKKVKGEDGMKKVDNKNAMADKMYEGKAKKKDLISEGKEDAGSVLMEGLDKSDQAAVQAQLERMRRLTFRR
jgi:hypothetical protein|tara:strand:- start:25391 stop:26233 length:843 start_codon:yes stop_codon:yes gene_type:complete